MIVKLFDPTGLKPVDYKEAYPELKRTKEFESVRGIELIFIWYYANATSPIKDIANNSKRVEEAIRLSGYNPEPDEYERLLKLQFNSATEAAIEKMSSYIPGARYFGWKVLKSIFEQYTDIISKGTSAFIKKSGSGDDASEEIDYAAYTTTSGKISSALPGLVARLEEGFGISVTGNISDEEEEGVSMLREWNLNRAKT